VWKEFATQAVALILIARLLKFVSRTSADVELVLSLAPLVVMILMNVMTRVATHPPNVLMSQVLSNANVLKGSSEILIKLDVLNHMNAEQMQIAPTPWLASLVQIMFNGVRILVQKWMTCAAQDQNALLPITLQNVFVQRITREMRITKRLDVIPWNVWQIKIVPMTRLAIPTSTSVSIPATLLRVEREHVKCKTINHSAPAIEDIKSRIINVWTSMSVSTTHVTQQQFVKTRWEHIPALVHLEPLEKPRKVSLVAELLRNVTLTQSVQTLPPVVKENVKILVKRLVVLMQNVQPKITDQLVDVHSKLPVILLRNVCSWSVKLATTAALLKHALITSASTHVLFKTFVGKIPTVPR